MTEPVKGSTKSNIADRYTGLVLPASMTSPLMLTTQKGGMAGASNWTPTFTTVAPVPWAWAK